MVAAILIVCFIAPNATLQAGFSTIFAPFPDTEPTHWAWVGRAAAMKEGFLRSWPEGMMNNGPWQDSHRLPQIFATCTVEMARTVAAFQNRTQNLTRMRPGDPAARDYAESLENDVNRYRDARAVSDLDHLDLAMRRAVVAFRNEFIKLGEHPADLLAAVPSFRRFLREFKTPRVGSALEQFPDVPSDHWAAKAVLDLRRWGLIDGYPDGRFGK